MTIVLLIIFGFIALHLASNVINSAICLFEEGKPLFPDLPDPDSIPLKARLGSIGREIGLQTLFRLLWPLGLLPERLPLALTPGEDEGDIERNASYGANSKDGAQVPALAQATHRPVLLLHGYAHNRAVLYPLKIWLTKTGFVALTFDHSRDRGSIEDKARHLARRVEILKQLIGADSLDIVAHSLGGLVARYYIEHLGGAASVKTLITLGTPHQGTKMGVFARRPLGTQLLPGSDIIKTLAHSLNALKDVNYTAIAGELDTVIFPVETALLPAPHGRRILKGLGHNTLLGNIRVFQAIRETLAGPTETPAPEPVPTLIPGRKPHLSLVRLSPSPGESREATPSLMSGPRSQPPERDRAEPPDLSTEKGDKAPLSEKTKKDSEGPEEPGRDDN